MSSKLFKLSLTILALWFVFSKVSFNELLELVKNLKPGYLILSLLALAISHIVSGIRMQYYFKSQNIWCGTKFALALNFVGMFYNLILPGGIGGDGYKIYIMQKLENTPKLLSLRLVLSNRANGLYLLFIINFILCFFSTKLNIEHKNIIIIASFLITTFGYFILAKLLLKESFIVAIKACNYSFIVQITSLLSSYFLFKSIGINDAWQIDYLILFMISSIVSILPISIGGAGLRELSFLYGSQFFQLPSSIGVTFAVIYFILNFCLSLIGIIFATNLNEIHQSGKINNEQKLL